MWRLAMGNGGSAIANRQWRIGNGESPMSAIANVAIAHADRPLTIALLPLPIGDCRCAIAHGQSQHYRWTALL
jgi:hypothetical protein